MDINHDLARRLKVRALGWAAGLGCAGLGSAAAPTAAGLGLCCADGCWAGLSCCADGCIGGSQVLKNWRATWPFGGSQKWDRPVAPKKLLVFVSDATCCHSCFSPGVGTAWWPPFWVLVFEALVRSSMRLAWRWSGPLCFAACDLARCSLRLGPRWPVPLQTRLSSELA